MPILNRTHGLGNCNLHLDKMHLFLAVQHLTNASWALISVPRLLLLLTWETDTFLNASNWPEEPTRAPTFPAVTDIFKDRGLVTQRSYNNYCKRFLSAKNNAKERINQVRNQWKKKLPQLISNGFFSFLLNIKMGKYKWGRTLLLHKIIFYLFDQALTLNRVKEPKTERWFNVAF